MKKQLFNKLRWLFLCVGILCLAQTGWSQDRQVTGKVTNAEDGSPTPGVSIIVKGTTRGTSSAADGTYKLSVSPGATLIFTSLGFERREVKVGNQSEVNVILTSDIKALDEVVVTALGINEKKRGLGYSVGEVKGAVLAETNRENFMVGMQGRVAGLSMTTTSGQPGSSVAIQLRGASSIGGSNSPLYIIDGLPVSNNTFSQGALTTDQPNRANDYTNRMADLNPNDIESVTVLKGLEAAALYGIEASAGAIIITTKKGVQGKSKVTYENSFRTDNVFRTLETQRVYGRGINGVSDNTVIGYRGAKYAENTQFFDNTKNFFQTGRTQTHNLGIEGGNDKMTYRISTSYTSQDGVTPTSNYDRLTLRLSSTAKLSPKLDLSTTLGLTKSSVVKPIRSEYGFYIGLLMYPATEDVNNYLTPAGTRRRLLSIPEELDNPLFNVNKNQNNDRTTRTQANLTLNFNPTKWLNVTGRFGADVYSTLGNYLQHPESNRGIVGKGFIENYNESGQLLNGNVLATVKKEFGDFKTSLMVGGEVFDNRYEVTSVYGEQLYIPDFNSINNALPTTMRNKLTVTRKRIVSGIGKLDLNYKDLFYITATGRNDMSSTLPETNNSFFYPAVSTSFIFSEIGGLKDALPALSMGKIRASYAQGGKDAPPYKVLAALTPQTTSGGGFAYGVFGGNEGLKPERSEGIEFGLEMQFFNGRLGLDASRYSKTVSDQIVSQRLSYGTGFILGLLNGGTFTNSGYELQLKGTPLKTTSFGWDIIANFTTLTTSVKNLPADVAEYYNSDTWLVGNARASAFVSNLQTYYPTANLEFNQRGAGSATAIGGYSYLRNKRGDILINPTSGLPVINTNFLPIGDRNPDFTVGLTNTFTYKNVRLSFLLDIRKGGDVFNGNEYFLFRNGLSKNTLDREKPVTFNGVLRDGKEETDTPTKNNIQITPLTRSDYFSSFAESDFVERDINWLRLRDVTVSYTLPKALLQRTKLFQAASVFVTGTDLFLVTNYKGADPNVNGTTATSLGVGASGFDFGTLAVPRGISFGVRVTF
jgi:TonB-linked SusC/RagA family outer membrane protein